MFYTIPLEISRQWYIFITAWKVSKKGVLRGPHFPLFWIQENTDQKKLRIWTLFAQCKRCAGSVGRNTDKRFVFVVVVVAVIVVVVSDKNFLNCLKTANQISSIKRNLFSKNLVNFLDAFTLFLYNNITVF